MNVFTYLSTQTFLTENHEPIDPNKEFDEKSIQRIQLDYNKYNEQFGLHHDPKFGCGELARRYPGLFREDIALSFFPNNTPDFARFLLALNMMSAHIHYYAEPRYDNNGDLLFSELKGYQEAISRGCSYILMEDLS